MCEMPRPETKGRDGKEKQPQPAVPFSTNVSVDALTTETTHYFHTVRDWNELCPEPVQSPSLGIFILRVSSYPQLTVIILHFHLHHKELNICTWQGKKTSLLLNLNRYNSKDSFQYCAQARQNSGNAWDSVTPSPEHSFHLQPMHALQTQETYIYMCYNMYKFSSTNCLQLSFTENLVLCSQRWCVTFLSIVIHLAIPFLNIVHIPWQ